MLGNRDILRTNKANRAIQASIFANIGKDSLTALKKVNNAVSSNLSSVEPILTTKNKLVDIASVCNEKMLELFNDSQESLGKYATKYYATEQHGRMTNAVRNKEDIENISEISSYIYNDEIIKMYRDLDSVYQSESKYPSFIY